MRDTGFVSVHSVFFVRRFRLKVQVLTTTTMEVTQSGRTRPFSKAATFTQVAPLTTNDIAEMRGFG